MSDPKDDWMNAPILNYCEYLLLKKVAQSEENMTRYDLMLYGRTIDICEPTGMRYNKVSRFVEKLEGKGYVILEPPFEGALMKWVKITPEGLTLLERHRLFYEGY